MILASGVLASTTLIRCVLIISISLILACMAREFRVHRGMGRGAATPTGDAVHDEEGVASLEVGGALCGGSIPSSMILRSLVDTSLLLLSGVGGSGEGCGPGAWSGLTYIEKNGDSVIRGEIGGGREVITLLQQPLCLLTQHVRHRPGQLNIVGLPLNRHVHQAGEIT